jgi:predicted AlkP superfamily pyrophosphatase or phosphodiesterase
MPGRRPIVSLVASLLLALFAFAATAGSNARAADRILVLISLDGWRWDYLDRASAPNLRGLAARGVRARSLVPSFPSSTFPNHYTIVTGLRPERHGIVANTMREPGFGPRFTMSSATAKTARWWGGEPLWVTAIRQGLRAAAMFWPGSEAPIQGVRPTHWLPFADGMSNEARVAQVLDWLALADERRPSFITLYFSDVDDAGHDHGPDSPEVLAAASRVDAALGRLIQGVAALGLLDRVNFVVVSDHGMAALDRSRVIELDDYLDLSSVEVVEWSPLLTMWPRRGTFDALYRALAGKDPHLRIYRRDDVPAHLHYRNHVRIPDVIGIVDEGWLLTSSLRRLGWRLAGFPRGGHGFDPRAPAMHGLFVAAGPQVKVGQRIEAFENVHVYEVLCRILGVDPADNQGDSAIARAVTR